MIHGAHVASFWQAVISFKQLLAAHAWHSWALPPLLHGSNTWHSTAHEAQLHA
jgi:hypothetical protein